MFLNKQIASLKNTILLGVAVVFVAGCQFDTPNTTTQTPMRIVEQTYQDIRPTELINRDYLNSQAYHYDRTGQGPFEIRVTYNPEAPTQTSHWAKKKLKYMQRKLKKAGVANIDAGILPVKNLDESQTILRYTSYQAKAPRECDGVRNHMNTIDPDQDYIIGCTHKSIFAKQIYRQTDLLDHQAEDNSDSADKYSSPVDTYRSGARSPGFETITSTDE